MKDFIKENIQFIIMLLVWVAFGIIMKETSYLLVPAGLILLKSKGMYTEMIAAFFLFYFFQIIDIMNFCSLLNAKIWYY